MLTDLLSLPYILGVIGLGVGALTLPKKHWYRSAQVLFAAAALLADAKVIRWALTSENGIKTRIGFGLFGFIVVTVIGLWVISKAQSDIRESAKERDVGRDWSSEQRALIESWRRMVVVAERKYKSGKEPAVSFAEIIQRQPEYLSLLPLLSSGAIEDLEWDKRPARGRRPPDALRSILANEITRIETKLKLAPSLLPESDENGHTKTPLFSLEVVEVRSEWAKLTENQKELLKRIYVAGELSWSQIDEKYKNTLPIYVEPFLVDYLLERSTLLECTNATSLHALKYSEKNFFRPDPIWKVKPDLRSAVREVAMREGEVTGDDPAAEKAGAPLLTFEVDTESGSSEISIGYADEDEAVGLLEATIKMKFWNSNIHDSLIKKLSISIFRKSTSIEMPLAEESISKLTFRTGIGESRYFSGLTVPASSPTEDYWFRFVSYVRQDTVGELDRDCVLRLTMVAARQESYSVDFPVSWQRAKEGNGYLLSPGMRWYE